MRSALRLSDESVRAGAQVFTTDGTEVGIVIHVEPTMFIVKKSGLLGGEVELPRALIAVDRGPSRGTDRHQGRVARIGPPFVGGEHGLPSKSASVSDPSEGTDVV
jgi:hypothetical protein